MAVADEQYAEASQLKEYIAQVRSSLPPHQQFVLQKLQELDFGSQQEQQAALAAIGVYHTDILAV